MRCTLQFSWGAHLFFCLSLLWHFGEARVHTEAQAGPLYRVVGSPLFISCSVSGFASASIDKDFEFRIFKPANPNFEINIISTKDPDFGYAIYQSRVRSKDITVNRTSPNSVVFEIQNLEKNDEGDYECTAVNHEGTYDGTYSVKTTVKVIDNSLSVSSSGSASLNYDEGDALTLTCQVSSNTIQHTHLSVTWYLLKGNEDSVQPIISLDKDFKLSPGLGFEGRYQAGLIMLDKVGQATYKLKMVQVELSDRGRIYCEADEWIQDPDRSWYSIARKDAGKTTLLVKAKEVVADKSSLLVKISAQQTTLQEGQELSLSCTVDTQNLEERFFSVALLQGSVELAKIGPTGILSLGSEYSSRGEEGELRAARTGNRDYNLRLKPVRTEDQGEYICRAWLQERGQDGAFTQGAAQDSIPLLVSISATESGLSVEMTNSNVNVNEGDRLRLSCTVRGVNGQLSVTWQRKLTSTSTATFTNVIGLSRDGVMEKVEEFKNRKVKAMRPASDTFILELDEVTLADLGAYKCAVSEWKVNTMTNSQFQVANVQVVPADLLVKVNLISRNSIVTVGDNVELICRVRGPPLQTILTWSLQRDASNLYNILTVHSDGTISWSGDQYRYQLKVESRPNELIYYLIINGASRREAGRYQCSVSVVMEKVYKKLPASNQLAVEVKNPVSNLDLTSTPGLTRVINTDIEIKCSVTSDFSKSARYAVTWVLQQKGKNMTILSSDRDSLVTFWPQVERQRISMRRTEGPSFELTIRQSRISDSGSYVCEVVEWLQDPHGEWYQLSSVSKTTELTLIEPDNDLHVDKEEQEVIIKVGDEVEFKCNITSGALSSSFFYKVTWLYADHDSSTMMTPLVELDHTGLLRYPKNQGIGGLQGRLRPSRPVQNSFYLGIQRANEEDSGIYQCQVEQYQLDHQSQWQQKASDLGGFIRLSVNVTDNDLHVDKEEQEVIIKDGDEVEFKCNITSGALSSSFFYKVTWLYTDSFNVKTPLVELDHTGLLRYPKNQMIGGLQGRLRPSRPVQNSFYLGIQRAHEEDSGTYQCQVEQYQLDHQSQWQQKASDLGGSIRLSVNVTGEAVSDTGCNSGTWIGAFVGTLVICSLIVVSLFVLTIYRTKASARKSGESLWAEQPLKKPGVED